MTETPDKIVAAGRGSWVAIRTEFFRMFTESIIGRVLFALILSCVVLSLTNDKFLTEGNILNILSQSSLVGIAAMGATLVIITAGIDLSVGATVALAGMAGALLLEQNVGSGVGLMLIVVVGCLVGVVNGFSVSVLGMAPFIVTLATLGMARGLTFQISDAESVYDLPAAFVYLGRAEVLGIPLTIPLMLVVALAAHVLLTRTVFGHHVFAIGGNREAARLAGIPVKRVLFAVYVIAGFCAGLAAIVLVGRLGAASPTAAEGLELQVIAAVVIGGTSLFGGRGSMIGTLIGVLLIAVINNGLILMQVSPYLVQFMQGGIIFVAVLLDALNNRRTETA